MVGSMAGMTVEQWAPYLADQMADWLVVSRAGWKVGQWVYCWAARTAE